VRANGDEHLGGIDADSAMLSGMGHLHYPIPKVFTRPQAR